MIWPSDDRWFQYCLKYQVLADWWVCVCGAPSRLNMRSSRSHSLQYTRFILTLHGRLPTEPVSLRFYRATLCVSTVFAIAQCLPVRHVGVLYPDGWTYLQTFSWAGSLKILVFDPECWYPIHRGTPSAGCLKYQGEFCDFRLKSPSISEMVRERSIVAMER